MPTKPRETGTRKARGRKADPIQFVAPQVPNDHIIRDAIALGLSGSDDNGEILKILQRHPQNLDTILDDNVRDAQQATLIAEGRLEREITDADRIEKILDFVNISSSDKGEQEWLALLSPDRKKLVNIQGYRKLLLQRLNEQIRAVRRKVRDASKREAKVLADHVKAHGEALSMSWSEAAENPEELEWIPTGSQLLDEFFGYEEKKVDGKTIRVGGLINGHTYLVGAPHGLGKTRWLVNLLSRLCGSTGEDIHGRLYGGMTGLYIQGEETPSRFASMFVEGLWKPGVHDIHLSDNAVFMAQHETLIRRIQPSIIVIDSKDIMEDWKNPSAANRNAKIYNRWAVEYGFVLFVISHVNKEGKIKGGTGLSHMLRSEILGSRNEHDPKMFSFQMGKNRGAQSGGIIHFRHGPDTVHLIDPNEAGGSGLIKMEFSPDAAMLATQVEMNSNRPAIPHTSLVGEINRLIGE